MADTDIINILNDMSEDDRTMLLEELPAKVTQQLINRLSDTERSITSQLLGYPENSVGRLMTSHFVRVRPGRLGFDHVFHGRFLYSARHVIIDF